MVAENRLAGEGSRSARNVQLIMSACLLRLPVFRRPHAARAGFLPGPDVSTSSCEGRRSAPGGGLGGPYPVPGRSATRPRRGQPPAALRGPCRRLQGRSAILGRPRAPLPACPSASCGPSPRCLDTLARKAGEISAPVGSTVYRNGRPGQLPPFDDTSCYSINLLLRKMKTGRSERSQAASRGRPRRANSLFSAEGATRGRPPAACRVPLTGRRCARTIGSWSASLPGARR